MGKSALEPILIFGTGGQAKVVFDAISAQNAYLTAGFIVDDRVVQPDEQFIGFPVFAWERVIEHGADVPRRFIVGIGDNQLRCQKQRSMIEHGFEPVTVVHPFSRVGCLGKLGLGTLICGGATIDPDVEIGDGTIINGGAVISHDSRIGSFVHQGPGAILGGTCRIGDLSFLGMGAMLLSGLSVGRNSFVAAGALVTKHVPDDMMAIGVPARIRQRK